MKVLQHKNNSNLLKKIFIKICRLFGYEIIDQSNFYVPTLEKNLNESLNISGLKSINVPLGETIITRRIDSLTVIFRSCTKVNMLTQSKKRLFECNKSEYTFRSLNSIISALKNSLKTFPKVNFNIIIVDHNSDKKDLYYIKEKLNKSKLKNSIINLDINEFLPNIKNLNAKNEKVSDNQISNMCNIHKSLQVAKKQCDDLIYFVEDDYIHEKDSFNEMLYTYERLSSQLKRELILCPSDYPFLYSKIEPTNLFIGANKHWRKIDQTLCTFLTSKILLDKYWNEFTSMCLYEHYPFEEPLHKIYKSEYCLSPVPSLAIHLTNVNSVYGLSPNVDWNRIWEENKN